MNENNIAVVTTLKSDIEYNNSASCKWWLLNEIYAEKWQPLQCSLQCTWHGKVYG